MELLLLDVELTTFLPFTLELQSTIDTSRILLGMGSFLVPW